MAGLDKICAKIPEVCFWHGFDIFTYQWPYKASKIPSKLKKAGKGRKG